jgi:hypothetical protein
LYEEKSTESQKLDKEEEVVQIVDRFRKGDLNVNAEEFLPQQNPERAPIDVEPVEIIKEDCRSMIIPEVNRTKRIAETSERKRLSQVALANPPQQVLPREVVDIYENINTKCSDSLQKFTKVKMPRKRGNFNSNEERRKFQGVKKEL